MLAPTLEPADHAPAIQARDELASGGATELRPLQTQGGGGRIGCEGWGLPVEKPCLVLQKCPMLRKNEHAKNTKMQEAPACVGPIASIKRHRCFYTTASKKFINFLSDARMLRLPAKYMVKSSFRLESLTNYMTREQSSAVQTADVKLVSGEFANYMLSM